MNSQGNNSFKKPTNYFNQEEDEYVDPNPSKSKQTRKNNETLSKILDIKTSNRPENNPSPNSDRNSEGLSKHIESQTDIKENYSPVQPSNQKSEVIKASTIIKKFNDAYKPPAEETKPQVSSETQALSKAVLQNFQLSTFKRLAQKNDPTIKSLFKTSKIMQNLGDFVIKGNNMYDTLLKDCKTWNKRYTDPDFPPEQASLAQDWTALSAKQKVNWKKYVWRRADEIFGSDYDVFYDDIEPNDIKQGQLGDCYLLSSLSSLAERPHIVRKIFHPDVKNEQGIYNIWLNVNGMWTSVIIDDYFPCLGEKSGPSFSRGNGNELWVLLLEKAYAKVFGCYHFIEGGNPAVALRDLTGAPYENKDEASEEEMWEYIKSNDKLGFILTCYTRSTMIQEEENDLGLLAGHAYAILDCQDVVGTQGADKIIKIRNPWGKVEWKGRWADKSNEWTPALLKKLEVLDKDDGTFWINISDFRKYYEGVGICKYHEAYVFDSIQVKVEKFAVVKLTVPQFCSIYISLNQHDERMYMNSPKKHAYSYARLFVAEIEADGLKFIGGEFKQDQVLTIETALKEGEYLILIEVDWMQDIYREIVLNTYGTIHVNLEEKKMVSEKEFLHMERNVLKSYALTLPAGQKSMDFNKLKQSDIKSYTSYEFGMLYFYYANKSKSSILDETIAMTKLINLKISPPLEDSMLVNINLMPQTETVIMFKFVPSENPSTTYGYKTNSKITASKGATSKAITNKELYNVNYIEFPDNNTQNTNLIKKEPVVYNDNYSIVKEEAEAETSVNISSIEKWLFYACDTTISKCIGNWGAFFSVSLHIALMFVLIECFLRPDFLTLSLISVFEGILLSKKATQRQIRNIFYGFLFVIAQDIVWLILYTSNWVNESIYEPDTLDPLKKCSIAFSYICIFLIFWILYCTWRFSIEYEDMKKLTLLHINPFENNEIPVPEDQTQMTGKNIR